MFCAACLVAVLTACESTAAKADRLRENVAIACAPPPDSATVDSLFRAGVRPTDPAYVRTPGHSDAQRLAAAQTRCDVDRRELNAFLAGQ